MKYMYIITMLVCERNDIFLSLKVEIAKCNDTSTNFNSLFDRKNGKNDREKFAKDTAKKKKKKFTKDG